MMSNKSEKGNSEASIMEKKEERTGERTVATTVVMSDKENDQQESACMGMGSDVKNSVEKNVDNNAVSNTENTTVNNAENNAENNVDNNPESDELPELVASTAGRIPFTSLSQVDADMALARALQEQERAYMLLRMGADGSEFDSSESNSGRFEYEGALREVVGDEESDDAEDEDNEEDEEEGASEEEDEEVVFDGQGTGSEEQLDGALFDSDEAFARALQDKDDRDTLARLMAQAGIHDFEGEYETDSNDSQDMWQDVDPDNMSYEELIALGEAVGTESRGLSTEAIAALPRFNYALDSKDDSTSAEQCVVCRIEYEDGDPMLSLPCKHQYHSECIEQWLHINKVCPVCSAEVCPTGSSNSENKR